MKLKSIIHKPVWQFVCLLCADGLVFSSTNSQNSRSFMLIIGFVLLSLTVYYVLKGLLSLPGLYGLPIKHKRRLLPVLTALSASLAALQSIGQLSLRDVMVLSLLTVLLYVYATHAKSPKQQFDAG